MRWFRRKPQSVVVTALTRPEDIKAGDEVLVLLTVAAVVASDAAEEHPYIYAVPAKDSMWKVHEHHVYTYGRTVVEDQRLVVVK